MNRGKCSMEFGAIQNVPKSSIKSKVTQYKIHQTKKEISTDINDVLKMWKVKYNSKLKRNRKVKKAFLEFMDDNYGEEDFLA